jgi:hypothetical protein
VDLVGSVNASGRKSIPVVWIAHQEHSAALKAVGIDNVLTLPMKIDSLRRSIAIAFTGDEKPLKRNAIRISEFEETA